MIYYTEDSKDIIHSLIEEENVKELLSKLEGHHRETYNHSLRVGFLSVSLGVLNGESELYVLGRGALLHDIGKLYIPEEVLSKPSALDDREEGMMWQHPRIGFLLAKSHGLGRERHIIVGHHEWQRNSYPRSNRNGYEGRDRRVIDPDIRKMTEMVAAADMFDALRYERSYKGALLVEEVAEELKDQYKGEEKYIDDLVRLN